MKILKDNLIGDKNTRYIEFEINQLIVELAPTDKVTVMVNDQTIKEYTAKYINCHFNMVIQDKGMKSQDVKI